jgi:hypothetical protein
MQLKSISRRVSAVVVLMLTLPLLVGSWQTAQAADFAGAEFKSVWTRTDKPVSDGSTSRTYLWGPQPNSSAIWEPYAQSPGGKRLVQYFDKSRMEINTPSGDKSSPYYVSNGLIAKELITGQVQVGDASYEQREAANSGVAGDADDTSGPTYQALQKVLHPADANDVGILVAGAIDRQGNTRFDVGDYGKKYQVSYAYYAPETQHNIAGPFWSFLNQTGPVINSQGNLVTARLFDPVFYATGLPITEAYWAQVKVAGQVKDVLVQAFERRVLTFTPSNSPAFQVEMGNVGQHYYNWRYATSRPVYDKGFPGKLVYESYGHEIFTVNPDGSDARKVAEGRSPIFSPDGKITFLTSKTIASNSSRSQLNFEVINVDGSDRHVLYSMEIDGTTGLVRWSPRGRYIAYWLIPHRSGLGDIYLLNVENKTTSKIETKQGTAIDTAYDWTPDGNYALWQAGTVYNDQNLYYGDPDKNGEGAVALTNGQLRHEYESGDIYYSAARFSPDGKTIAVAGSKFFFLSVPGQKSPLEGKTIEGLEGEPYKLAWSPDGQALGVLVSLPDNSTRLYVLNLENMKFTEVARNAYSFDWSRQ